jgi:putative transposase
MQRSTRGGRREGAGRPRKASAGVAHLRRETFPRKFPLHVTLRVREEVGNLRTDRRFRRIQRAFLYGGDRFGMRLNHFALQGGRIHLIVEARDRRALARGIQGLAIRLARGINRVSQRRGRVFADRYRARILRTAPDVRRAIHGLLHISPTHPWGIDPFSSASGDACWYVDEAWRAAMIIVRPRTWLLRHAPS